MSCLQSLISGIGWRHWTRWVGCWIQVRWRLVRGTCIYWWYPTTHTWRAEQNPLARFEKRFWKPLSCLSVTVTELKIQSWKVRTFFFLPLLLVECFLLFLEKRIPRKSLSIDHENVLITHISVEMKYDHIAQCEWVHKLQEFNLLVIQTPKIKLV